MSAPPVLYRSHTLQQPGCEHCGRSFAHHISRPLGHLCVACGTAVEHQQPYAWFIPGYETPPFKCELTSGRVVEAHVIQAAPPRHAAAQRLGRFWAIVSQLAYVSK